MIDLNKSQVIIRLCAKMGDTNNQSCWKDETKTRL